MGGGGMGMFAVEDELNLGTKKPAAEKAPSPQPSAKADSSSPTKASAKKVKPGERITLKAQYGETPAQAWERFFADQESRISGLENPKPAMQSLLAQVRQTVRQLMDTEKKYGEASTLIEAALRHGIMEPWMYEALALSIRADAADKMNKGITVDAAQKESLERALLSAVDFAQDEDQLVSRAASAEPLSADRQDQSRATRGLFAGPGFGPASE